MYPFVPVSVVAPAHILVKCMEGEVWEREERYSCVEGFPHMSFPTILECQFIQLLGLGMKNSPDYYIQKLHCHFKEQLVEHFIVSEHLSQIYGTHYIYCCASKFGFCKLHFPVKHSQKQVQVDTPYLCEVGW